MKPLDEDADLERAFEALRREEADTAPDFGTMVARARHGLGETEPGPGLLRAGGGLLVAASLVAAVVLTVVPRGPRPAPPSLTSIEHWVAPTDFLLQTPGLEVLSTVPRIGGPPSLPGSEEPSQQPRPQRSTP